MMSIYNKVLYLSVLSFLTSSVAFGQVTTTVFNITDDAMVNSFHSTQNYGTAKTMEVFAESSRANPVRRTFVEVDLSSIPTNAIVVSADLKMYANSVNNAVSHPFYVERVTNTWTEAGITWSNQPSTSLSDQISIPHSDVNTASTFHNLDITDHVQFLVNYPSQNNGWMIRLQDETPTVACGVIYASSEDINSSRRPNLEVSWVLPIDLTATVHHCTNGLSDGEIENVVVSGGSQTISTYTWKKLTAGNLSTIETGSDIAQSDISSLASGVYILEVTDDEGVFEYQYFLVGEHGSTMTESIYFNNATDAAKYWQDATTRDEATYEDDNLGSYTYTLGQYSPFVPHEFKTYMDFHVDFDFLMDIETTKLQLYHPTWHYRGTPYSNEIHFKRISETWQEDVVTHNTEPTVASDIIVSIPQTAAGYGYTDHTADITSFAEYWQDNPTDNHGLQFALSNPLASTGQWMRQIYGSSDNTIAANRPKLEIKYTVKAPLVASFDEEEEKGSLLVNAPNGELPYSYFLGYNSMPSMNDMWLAIKDSSSIDSTDFWEGDTLSQSFEFNNLPQGYYYVGVYDNSGNLIMDESMALGIDAIVYESIDITETNEMLSITSPAAVGYATLLGELETKQNGGFGYVVEDLSADYLVGFMSLEDTIPEEDSLYQYAISFSAATSTYSFIKGNTTLFSGNVSIGDKFTVIQESERNMMHLVQNNVLVGSNTYDDLNESRKVVVKMKGSASLISKPYFIGNLLKPKPLTLGLVHPECPDEYGSVKLVLPTKYFKHQNTTWTITNLDDLSQVNGVGDQIVPLGVGQYQLTYSYDQMVNGSWVSTYGGSEFFTIGYKIEWTEKSNIWEIAGTMNSITPQNPNAVATCESYNQSLPVGMNWIQFNWDGPYENLPIPPFSSTPSTYPIIELKESEGNQNVITQIKVHNPGNGLVSGFVEYKNGSTGGYDFFTAHNDQPILVEWDAGGGVSNFQIKHDGVLYNGTTTPIVTEKVGVKVKEYGKVRIDDAVANFCGPLVFNYADVTRKLDGGYYLAKRGILKFIYNEEYNDVDQSLSYEIFNSQNQVILSNADISLVSEYGDNRYTMDFSCSGDNILSNGVYVLKVTNEKNESWLLRFKITDNC